MIVAQIFGAASATDAFVAFDSQSPAPGGGRIPDGFFIPVIPEYLSQKTKEDSDGLVHASYRVVPLLLLLTFLGILSWIVKALAYGFSQDLRNSVWTVFLTRVMSPHIFSSACGRHGV
jgi:peptidoglycan biosynthesis protein MviN/MurJ (putative lipid II flippase)